VFPSHLRQGTVSRWLRRPYVLQQGYAMRGGDCEVGHTPRDVALLRNGRDNFLEVVT
jgi:hypothetical protein